MVVESETVGPFTVDVEVDMNPPNPLEEHDQLDGFGIDCEGIGQYGALLPYQRGLFEWFCSRDLVAGSGLERREVGTFLRQHAILPLAYNTHLSGSDLHCEDYTRKHMATCDGYVFVLLGSVLDEGVCGAHQGMGLDELRECGHEYLRLAVQELDDYHNSNVYGYVVREGEEELDSCWGFIGDEGYALEEGVRQAECMLRRRRSNRLRCLRNLIKHHVPLDKRAPLLARGFM